VSFFKEVLSRHVALLAVGLFIGLLGLRALTSMPQSLFPELNYPRVLVEVNMGYAPLQVMEWGVTSILERELRAVPGVRWVKSSSSRGQSSIDVFLHENEDITLAVQRVNAKIAEARSLIPPFAQISVRPITAAAFPSGEYCFTSRIKDPRKLRTFVEYTIKPLIMVIPGIFDAKVYGGDLPELRVQLDPQKLAHYNLNVSDVNERLKSSNGVDFLGPIETRDSQILAFGGKFAKTAEDIENIVVDSALGRPVRMGDLGHVELANAWKTKDSSLNGVECVGLDVFYQNGIDQKAAATQVAKTISDVLAKSPGNTYRRWDLNDFTDSATKAVFLDLGVGMLIIALVTLLFLRNFKYSLIALISMPLAACFTFLVMAWLGLSINLMTLGGLTAAIGLVVDNTVIILEMYHHRKSLEKNKSRSQILLETITSVVKPMLFGTGTIALVFTPIGFLSGVSGMFFAPMAQVHSAALMVSVFLALLIVPGLILLVEGKSAPAPVGREAEFEEGRFAGIYSRWLTWVLKKSRPLTLLFLVIPLLGAAALPFARTGFLPEWDEGDLVIDFRAITPIGLSLTTQKIKPVEQYLKEKVPEIDFFIRKVGTGLGSYTKVPYEGEIIVKLKKNRKRSVFEIKDEISGVVGKLAKGLEFDLFQILPDRLNDLSGSAKPIVLYLHGEDEEKTDEAAKKYRELLSGVEGLDSVRIEEPEKSPEVFFEIDERKSRALDLNPLAVSENVRFSIFSLDSSYVQNGPQSIPIRLTAKGGRSADLESVSLFSTHGGLHKMEDIGRIEERKSRIESTHIDGAPVRTLTAELTGRDLGGVVGDIQKMIEAHPVEGVYPELAGDYQMQQKSFKELVFAFLTGIAFIFMTVLFFSNRLSVALPLTFVSLIPPILGLLGCVVFHVQLDVSSFSGLISVTGIAVANSFMALSAIESLPAYREDLRASILKGMLGRLRPILMTNLAAMAGFVPIAMGLAQGDEILRPFSIAMIAGLFGAIYATLILTPSFYFHFARPEKNEV